MAPTYSRKQQAALAASLTRLDAAVSVLLSPPVRVLPDETLRVDDGARSDDKERDERLNTPESDAENGTDLKRAGDLHLEGARDHKRRLADFAIFDVTPEGQSPLNLPEAIRFCLFDCLILENPVELFFPAVTGAVNVIADWLIEQVDNAHVFDEDTGQYRRLNKDKFMIDFLNLLQGRRKRPELADSSLFEVLGRRLKAECAKRGSREFETLQDCLCIITDKLEERINFV